MLKKLKFLFVSCFLLSLSCEQYAIFDDISNEIKPKPAKIQGNPSKITGQGGALYVANGSFWRFAGGNWDKDGSAPSGVFSTAENGSIIFVPESRTVYQGSFGSWRPLDLALPGAIAGVFDGPSFLSVDNGKYYLTSASGGASFIPTNVTVNDKSASLIATSNGLYNNGSPIVTGYNVVGVLSGSKLGNIAVTSSGHLIVGSEVHALSKAFTGALAEDERGVLAGLSKGYCILTKDGGGYKAESPESSDGSTYTSTIGQRRVTSLAVSGNLIFACVISSTLSRSGLMSYRNGQWNMEQ